MDLFPDTSFIIPLIIETDTTGRARDYYSSFPGTCAASMSVYEEAFFVGLRLITEDDTPNWDGLRKTKIFHVFL